MAESGTRRKRHVYLPPHSAAKERFRAVGGGGDKKLPPEPAVGRYEHGYRLLQALSELETEAGAAREAQQAAGVEDLGVQVEFESFPGVALVAESLARDRWGIELQNVRLEEVRTCATVFVPNGKLVHFERRIRDYISEKKDVRERVIDGSRLFNAVREIRSARLRALWTDDDEELPSSDEEQMWWEVWLRVGRDRQSYIDGFRRQAEAQGMSVSAGVLTFPERSVLLAQSSRRQMEDSMATLNMVAELRRAKETAEFFDGMPFTEQREWLEDLVARTAYPPESAEVPHVCILDTGVNRGHSLVAPALSENDMHTVEAAWGTEDSDGHGTRMAGLALVGDLMEPLASSVAVDVGHRLESVKLLPIGQTDSIDSRFHGLRTVQAVARTELAAPHRRRVFGMAVTTRANRDRGRPSAWSAALDALAVASEEEAAPRRLLIVSAGNVRGSNTLAAYPASNDTDGVHDPGQAWNALTVGAYTNLTELEGADFNGYEVKAPKGGLSPYSTTSLTWQKLWPLKPDVVFEGGNVASDPYGAVEVPSLNLLTTSHQPNERPFTTANGTSAATMLASRFAARIMAAYPDFRPETIRALIVHSARWTRTMRETYLGDSPSKRDFVQLVRRCGYGVPNIERALWSVANSLTMVAEEELRPFERPSGKQPVARDMALHDLPWPKEELESLGETQVEMRVTLSYFIEPSPSSRLPRSRYLYESHGLRFEVKRPDESIEEFRKRINAAARSEGERATSGVADPSWLIGPKARGLGSIQSDTWTGSAADLASRGAVIVYPIGGWWKTRPALHSYERDAPYSLIVSIATPETELDLYAAVVNKAETLVEM